MPSRGSWNRCRSLLVITVLTSFCLASFVAAQQDQSETQDPDVVENEESSSIEEGAESASSTETEEQSREDSQADSEDSSAADETSSESEADDSELHHTPDFFDPSEDISEDFGVDFPVDI